MKISNFKQDGRKEHILSMFRYLLEHLEPEDRRSWKKLMVFSLISPATDIFSFSTVIYIINRVILEKSAAPWLIAFTLFMAAVSVLKCIFELYKSKLANRIMYHSAQKLSVKIYEGLIKEDLRSHYQKNAMEALTMVRQDTTNCIHILTACLGIGTNALTLAGYTAVLIYVSKWLGVASSLILLLLMAFEYFWTRERIKSYGAESREYSIRASSQITIAYGSFKEMKIDDRSAFVLEKYQKASAGYAEVESKYHYKSSSVVLILRNFTMCAIFAALAIILAAGSNLSAILVPMAAYVTALVRILPMVNSILNGLYNIEFAKKPFAKLKEMITKYQEIKKAEEQTQFLRRKTPTFHQGLFVEHITFQYNQRARIFEDASIRIPAGSSVAIIGVSGAGKTTLLDLILGLLKPQEGQIYFDDYDVVTQTDGEGPCKASLGQLVSYIPQTIYLNGETIRHNVAFFEEDAEIDDRKVEECLKCAQIWEDVQKMPAGIDTLIGENGTAISGGQRQRIALARALYKDFELLVMDEATAALDMETERAVIDSIRHIRAGKTLLMVTHHSSLANECDIIYKIENKKILQIKGNQ